MNSNLSHNRRATLVRTFACLTALAAATAFGCSDDSGTDIEVDGKSGSAGQAGTGGKANTGGSSAGKGGKTSVNGGAESMGGTADGGDENGGSAGAGGGGGKAGSGGQGGNAGNGGSAGAGGGGAAAGMAGTGGTTAGTGGTTAGTGGAAGSAGTAGTAGTSGTGSVVDCTEANRECEPDSTPLCSDTCEAVSTQACLDCEMAGDCFEFVDNCAAFEGTQKALCYDVVQCIQDSNCDDGTGTLGLCFCGDVPAANCGSAPLTGAGSPNGTCKDLIVEGLQPVATSSQVLGLLTASGRPAGGAGARLNCQKTANKPTPDDPGACYDVCGFGSTDPFPP